METFIVRTSKGAFAFEAADIDIDTCKDIIIFVGNNKEILATFSINWENAVNYVTSQNDGETQYTFNVYSDKCSISEVKGSRINVCANVTTIVNNNDKVVFAIPTNHVECILQKEIVKESRRW